MVSDHHLEAGQIGVCWEQMTFLMLSFDCPRGWNRKRPSVASGERHSCSEEGLYLSAAVS